MAKTSFQYQAKALLKNQELLDLECESLFKGMKGKNISITFEDLKSFITILIEDLGKNTTQINPEKYVKDSSSEISLNLFKEMFKQFLLDFSNLLEK